MTRHDDLFEASPFPPYIKSRDLTTDSPCPCNRCEDASRRGEPGIASHRVANLPPVRTACDVCGNLSRPGHSCA